MKWLHSNQFTIMMNIMILVHFLKWWTDLLKETSHFSWHPIFFTSFFSGKNTWHSHALRLFVGVYDASGEAKKDESLNGDLKKWPGWSFNGFPLGWNFQNSFHFLLKEGNWKKIFKFISISSQLVNSLTFCDKNITEATRLPEDLIFFVCSPVSCDW